jgi:hypothetical protein
MSNELSAEKKDVLISIKVTPTLDKRIKDIVKDKNWKQSAFLRVCIERELDRLKG